MKLEERDCLYCGDTFRPKREWQKFCCNEHKNLHHSEVRKEAMAALEREQKAQSNA